LNFCLKLELLLKYISSCRELRFCGWNDINSTEFPHYKNVFIKCVCIMKFYDGNYTSPWPNFLYCLYFVFKKVLVCHLPCTSFGLTLFPFCTLWAIFSLHLPLHFTVADIIVPLVILFVAWF
jgi:hypothetical protein